MPLYTYRCNCGYSHEQFLKADKDSIILVCERCGKNINARQTRDKTTAFKENNEVVGVFRHDRKNKS